MVGVKLLEAVTRPANPHSLLDWTVYSVWLITPQRCSAMIDKDVKILDIYGTFK